MATIRDRSVQRTRGGKRIDPRPRSARRKTPQPKLLSTQPSINTAPTITQTGVSLLQLNVEGLTRTKRNIIQHFAKEREVNAILLQETHSMDVSKLKINGYTLAACTNISTHGIAAYLKNCIKWKPIASSDPDDEIERTVTEIEGTVVINEFKPPKTRLQDNSITIFAPPCMYSGDVNSHSTFWSYRNSNADGIALENWASTACVQLVFDLNQPGSFIRADGKQLQTPIWPSPT